jgi:hypothetical protein
MKPKFAVLASARTGSPTEDQAWIFVHAGKLP